MKKKLLAKIFIPIIALGILVAPISPILKFENGKIILETKTNKASAENVDFVQPEVPTVTRYSKAAKLEGIITVTGGIVPEEAYNDLYDAFFIVAETSQGDTEPLGGDEPRFVYKTNFKGHPDYDENAQSQNINIITPSELKPDTLYATAIVLRDNDYSDWLDPLNIIVSFGTVPGRTDGKITTFQTLKEGDPNDINTGDTLGVNVSGSNVTDYHYDLNCGLFSGTNVAVTAATTLVGLPVFGAGVNLGACVAQLTYTLWELAAPLAQLAGSLLDFFVYYSTNSSSYTSPFLTIAWGTIRDIANIFFIIALLYIAIKTILNLNVSNNKRLIGAIIIAALLINFSFFITEVVIDASNILAKVFYNQIQPNQSGSEQLNISEQTPITEKLVANLDPMKIVGPGIYNNGINGISIFNLVAWLALGMTLFMAWIFISVAFIFIARVVSLWLCIIFSPFAFASYSLPFKIPGIGNQDWWNMLVKNAFLAPIFIFFLYVTVLFTEKFPQTIAEYFNQTDPSTMALIMKSLIPVLLCFVLLIKGKKLAVEWSGEMGKNANKVAGFATGTIGVKYVGGFLASKVGAAGRATVGRAGKAMSESKGLRKTGLGRVFADWGEGLSKKSFDLRSSGGYQKALGALGMGKFVGKGKGEGGYSKASAERSRKRMEAAEKMKPKASDPEMRALINSEKTLQSVLIKATGSIDKLDKQIDIAGKNASDEAGKRNLRRAALEATGLTGKTLATALKGDKEYQDALTKENIYRKQITAFKEHKNAVKNGVDLRSSKTTYQKIEKDGSITQPISLVNDIEMDAAGKAMNYSKEFTTGDKDTIGESISELERTVGENKRKVNLKHAEDLGQLAKSYDTYLNEILYGENEIVGDSHKIRMQEKLDAGAKH